jgi:hypothetical protein
VTAVIQFTDDHPALTLSVVMLFCTFVIALFLSG